MTVKPPRNVNFCEFSVIYLNFELIQGISRSQNSPGLTILSTVSEIGSLKKLTIPAHNYSFRSNSADKMNRYSYAIATGITSNSPINAL